LSSSAVRRGGRRRQADHQQHRADYAAAQHDKRKPWQIGAPQRRFCRFKTESLASQMNDTETDARAQVEQTGQQARADAFAEQQLGEWRARPERNGGQEGQRRAGPSQQSTAHVRILSEGCRLREPDKAATTRQPGRSSGGFMLP
jgi:hypothetical protein